MDPKLSPLQKVINLIKFLTSGIQVGYCFQLKLVVYHMDYIMGHWKNGIYLHRIRSYKANLKEIKETENLSRQLNVTNVVLCKCQSLQKYLLLANFNPHSMTSITLFHEWNNVWIVSRLIWTFLRALNLYFEVLSRSFLFNVNDKYLFNH